MMHRSIAALIFLLTATLPFRVCVGGDAPNYLYPDMFPYVDTDAPSSMVGIQGWSLSGNEIRFSSLFANQGDGLFEIRRGDSLNADVDQFIQRVYIDNDFGDAYQDFVIGTTPVPGTPSDPNPNVPFPTDSNVLWFEDFSTFSLHEAPVVDGVVTVGEEVASDTKTSWRLSANRGPLPGYANPPSYGSSDQSIEQRISAGYADLYSAASEGQFIDITGVSAGPLYWLRQTVDPENVILETDETNNSFEILIDLNQPGEAFTFAGEFIQPGDAPPLPDGDLTGDGQVDLDDWLAFKAGAEVSLDGLSEADAYLLGDLNLDGIHSLGDAVLFQQYYDEANGAGAFAALRAVPEPSSAAIAACVAAAAAVATRRRWRRSLIAGMLAVVIVLAPAARVAVAQTTLFFEDFEGLPLQPQESATECCGDGTDWTATPPTDWEVDHRTTPTGGPAEFYGWTFLDKDFWVSTAGDQQRSDFVNASGTVAVADPDEYDDLTNVDPDLFSTALTTPVIDVSNVAAGAAVLRFDSSWRDEDFQEAALFASIDGGAPTEIFRWDSEANANYKEAALNEVVTVGNSVSPSGQQDYAFDLNPTGSSTLQLIFDMPEGGNDWWWAIDNVEVFVPPTLTVDTESGEMAISGAADLVGYEVTSPAGSLDDTGWVAGNLDAQNYGSPTPMTADFNNDGVVDAIDYAIFRENEGLSDGGDADGDNQTTASDYALWAEQYGAAVGPGESWETLIAADDQLLEFFLGGSSTFESAPIGEGYDTAEDARDLTFSYATADGREQPGVVVYVEDRRSLAVPEPTAAALLAGLLSLAAAGRRRRGH